MKKIAALGVIGLTLAGCSSFPTTDRVANGALIGGVAGGAIGAVATGGNFGGIAIGAGIGAATGAFIAANTQPAPAYY